MERKEGVKDMVPGFLAEHLDGLSCHFPIQGKLQNGVCWMVEGGLGAVCARLGLILSAQWKG